MLFILCMCMCLILYQIRCVFHCFNCFWHKNIPDILQPLYRLLPYVWYIRTHYFKKMYAGKIMLSFRSTTTNRGSIVVEASATLGVFGDSSSDCLKPQDLVFDTTKKRHYDLSIRPDLNSSLHNEKQIIQEIAIDGAVTQVGSGSIQANLLT